jgi:glycosyltransferase involved in cell wall biosynthesis
MKEEQPFFSIIIPTLNRSAQLATCLQSLACLDYPPDRFEVIVVDDGNKTRPETLIASFCNRIDIVLTPQSHGGPAMARNTGAQKAKGEFLAFTDDDCIPTATWLQALSARFTGTRNVMIGGKTLNALPINLYSTATQLLIDYLYQSYNPYPDDAHFLTTNNLAMPAGLFRAVYGFDTTFPLAAGEDREFCERWLQHGYRMTYAPEVLVYHTHVFNFCTFLRKHFTYGRGAYRYHQVRAQRGFGPFRPDPNFYIRLILNPFIQKQRKRALRVTVLLMISQVANGLGFLWEGLNQHKRR